jgi:hypothetical protein
MKLRFGYLFLGALFCASLTAQDAAPPAFAPETIGLKYRVPSGWDAIDAQSTLPELKKRQTSNAKTEEEKREIACIEIPASARNGNPPSFLTVMALPFD